MIYRPSIITRRALVTGAAALAMMPRPARAAVTTWDSANKNYKNLLYSSDLSVTVTQTVFTFALDVDNKKYWVHNSYTGKWNDDVLANQDPGNGVGGWTPSPAFSGNPIYPILYQQSSSDNQITANFGALTITQLPSGFSSMNTAAGASVTWDTSFNSSGNIAYSNGNLTAKQTNSLGYANALLSRATHSVSSGKVCWAVYVVSNSNQAWGFGTSALANTNYLHELNNVGANAGSVWLYNNAATAVSATGSSIRMETSSTRATTMRSFGKLMFEATLTYSGLRDVAIGVANGSFTDFANVPGATNSIGYDINTVTQQITNNGGTPSVSIDRVPSGEKIGIYIDFGNQRFWYYVAGTANRYNSSGTADPATNTGGIDISALGSSLYPICGGGDSTSLQVGPGTIAANFGATAFTSPTPSGFYSWNDGAPATARSRAVIIQ